MKNRYGFNIEIGQRLFNVHRVDYNGEDIIGNSGMVVEIEDGCNGLIGLDCGDGFTRWLVPSDLVPEDKAERMRQMRAETIAL